MLKTSHSSKGNLDHEARTRPEQLEYDVSTILDYGQSAVKHKSIPYHYHYILRTCVELFYLVMEDKNMLQSCNRSQGATHVAFGSRFPVVCAHHQLSSSGKLHRDRSKRATKHRILKHQQNLELVVHPLHSGDEETDHQEVNKLSLGLEFAFIHCDKVQVRTKSVSSNLARPEDSARWSWKNLLQRISLQRNMHLTR